MTFLPGRPAAAFLLLCSILIANQAQAQEEDLNKTPDAPSNKYFIGVPTFSQDRLKVDLTYPISDFPPYENIRYTIFDGPLCGSTAEDGTTAGVITNSDYLVLEFEGDESIPQGDGDAFRSVTLSISFDDDLVRRSSIVTENPDLTTTVGFCVQMSTMSAERINPVAVSLYNRETFVTLTLLQDGKVSENIQIDDGGGLDKDGEIYTLVGFICDDANTEIVDPQPIFSGMIIRVCVTPGETAKAAGVNIRLIETFVWTRESIFQTSINYLQAPTLTTKVECEPGMLVCAFETFLKPQFFYRRGNVTGSGFGWLQFGTGPCPISKRARILMNPSSPTQLTSQRVVTNSTSLNIFDHTRQGQPQVTGSNCDGLGSSEWAGDGSFLVKHPVARLYRAKAFICDESNKPLVPEKHPLANGDKARICIKPDELAIRQDDVRIRSIDRFTWDRPEFNLTQTAISTNSVADSNTEIFCERGSLICAFETVLEDGFYGTAGIVKGTGVIWLQFGADSRRLQGSEFELGFELLPNMEAGFAGASPFEANIVVIPPKDSRELYECTIYECDHSLKKIEPQQQEKTEGDSIRMCVEPSDYAMTRGVNMWAIEHWYWWRKGFTQDAVVRQGKESPDGRTLLTCYRGDPICSFVTRLRGEFFNDTGAMFGQGYCWLTFGNGPFAAPMVGANDPEEDEDGEEGLDELDETEDGLYAGGNNINYELPVYGNFKIIEPECPEEDHQLSVWWENLGALQRWLIILGFASAASSFCCTCFCCLLVGYRGARRREKVKKEGGAITVNVGVNETNSSENIQSSTTSTTERSDETGPSVETLEMNQTLLNGQPEKHDVCFGDNRCPGTRECYNVVRMYLRNHEYETFGPTPYCKIINELLKREKRAFCIRDSNGADWRICTKHESISCLGEMWRDIKQKQQQR